MDTGMPHDKFAEKMKAQGIKVVGRTWPGYDSWSRISVGTPEETDACVKALKRHSLKNNNNTSAEKRLNVICVQPSF